MRTSFLLLRSFGHELTMPSCWKDKETCDPKDKQWKIAIFREWQTKFVWSIILKIEYLIWDCDSKNWLVYDTRSFQLLSTLPEHKNNLLPTQAFLLSATFNYLCVASRIVRLFQLNKAKHLWKWNLMLTFKLAKQICVSVDYLTDWIDQIEQAGL